LVHVPKVHAIICFSYCCLPLLLFSRPLLALEYGSLSISHLVWTSLSSLEIDCCFPSPPSQFYGLRVAWLRLLVDLDGT
jgi:hypothetical protein